jgi:hypothetical protein
MGKIEDILMADEQVKKKQSGVQMSTGQPGMPNGDLYLTNKRLIFIVSKGLSILTPGAGIGSKDTILSLQDIKSVEKSMAHLKIKTDKEYQFAVSAWHTTGWVDAMQEAIALCPPPSSQAPSIQPPEPPASQTRRQAPEKSARKFCPHCGSSVRSEAKFCESCGTRLQ